MSFPLSPVNAQQATVNGITYTYSTASNAWKRVTGVTVVAGVTTISAGTDTSVSATSGDIKVWNNSTLQTVASRGSSTNLVISLTNTTQATSTNSGALQVSGGVGVGGNIYAGGVITATNLYVGVWPVSTSTGGTTSPYAGIFTITNTTQATSTNTGALQVTGGVGVGSNLYVGGTAIVGGAAVWTTATLTNNNQLTNGAGYITSATLGLYGVSAVNAGAGISVNSNTGSVTVTNTGVLSLAAGIDISLNTTTGNVVISDTSTLQSVTGRGAETSNAVTISNNTNATTTLTGALIITGGAGIGRNLYVGGAVVINNAQAWTTATLTDLNQLNNTPGYLTTLTLGLFGVSSIVGTTYVGVSSNTGSVTITNLGVQTLTAGTDTSVSRSTGTVVVWSTSTLQSITNRGSATSNALQITNLTQATSVSTGALVVSGGAAISGNLYVGNTATVNGAVVWTTATLKNVSSLTNDSGYITSATLGIYGVSAINAGTGISVSGNTGSVTVTNIGVTALNSGDDINLTTTTGVVTVSDKSTLQSVTNRGAATSNAITISATTASTSTSSGALIVAGGIGIGGNINGGGNLSVAGISTITNITQATSTNTGALQVRGGAGIAGDLYVGGTVTASAFVGGLTGTATTATQVNVVQQTGNASYYITFVDTNNTSATGELIYTTSTLAVNPSTGNVGIGTSSPASKLNVSGDVRITGITTVTNTTQSTSTSTGALQVAGGVGIAGNIYGGANLNIVGVTTVTNTTAVASTNTGALQVAGGVGIAGGLFVGGVTTVTNLVRITALSAPTVDQFSITNAGFPVVTAGANNLSLTFVGGAAAVESAAGRVDITPGTTTGGTWSGWRSVASSGAFSGVTYNAFKADNMPAASTGTANAVYVGTNYTNILNYNGTTLIDGTGGARFTAMTLTNTTQATSTVTGALQVAGGAGIGGNLYVGGEIVAQKLTIQLTTVTTTLIQTDDQIQTYNTTQSTSTTTGALIISGGAGIGGNMYVGGTIFGTITTATNIAAGTTGSLHYQVSPGVTGFIGTGTNGYVLTMVNNTASWAAAAGSSLTGGTTGSIIYQTAPGVTGYIGIGQNGYILTSNGTTATWVDPASVILDPTIAAIINNNAQDMSNPVFQNLIVGNPGDPNLLVDSSGNTTIGNTLITTDISSGSTGTEGTITGQWTLVGTSTFQATYADLAEYYEADQEYPAGTVLVFGGSAEVTTTTQPTNRRVAGVVSDKAAYIMNIECPGIKSCVALQGRVLCMVTGRVQKGDMLVTSDISGYAVVNNDPPTGSIIGKSLVNKLDDGFGTIEVAVGRL